MSGYALRLLVAIDQLGNTILGGSEDETISSRVGRNALAGKRWALICERLINGLFRFLCKQDDHCRSHIEWDEAPNRDEIVCTLNQPE